MIKRVSMGFDATGLLVPIASILPLKQLSRFVTASGKYEQVLASVRELGIIEPLIVFPQRDQSENYFLLDGHLRLEALKQLGATHARCLVSTDDEAFTYNKRLNQLSTIQEHEMILKAIRNGVAEERIAKVLHVDVAQIREKRDLLKGICKEASVMLRNRRVSPRVFRYLRMMKPVRQVEVVELLCVANNFAVEYAKALLASTRPDMLISSGKSRVTKGLTPEQVSKMENEMEELQRDLKLVEESYSDDMLNLALACGYLKKLLSNARIVQYLGENHHDILNELQRVSEASTKQ